MEVDVACAGFGPAVGGFLTTLTRAWSENPADPAFESKVAPGMPLQVMCYERADDIAPGVSGVVTRAKGIRASFPDLKVDEIPMAAEVRQERVLYLLDPIGASRRSFALRAGDACCTHWILCWESRITLSNCPGRRASCTRRTAWSCPLANSTSGSVRSSCPPGLVQIWPGTPVKEPLFTNRTVTGLRLADQGVDKQGAPADGFMAGMDVHARLTVVGDGPVGALGQAIDDRMGMPSGHARREWAMGHEDGDRTASRRVEPPMHSTNKRWRRKA